jgi:hypothetical protein
MFYPASMKHLDPHSQNSIVAPRSVCGQFVIEVVRAAGVVGVGTRLGGRYDVDRGQRRESERR